MARDRTGLLLAFMLILTIAPAAAAEPAPAMPVTTPAAELVMGYDWAARPWATHLLATARPLASTVSLDGVTTKLLDIEMDDLMPGRSYRLKSGLQDIPAYANATGVAILWSVPAEARAWVLTDTRSGEPVTTLVVERAKTSVAPVEGLTIFDAPAMTEGCSWWEWWCEETVTPPQPEKSEDLLGGEVIQGGAYSFTKDATIEISNKWSRAISIGAYVTGGIAGSGGTAGGDFTYESTETLSYGSIGKPVEVRRSDYFRKDTYSDGSYKIYAIGSGRVISSRAYDLTWPPPSDDDPDVLTFIFTPDQTVPTFTREESKTVAVSYEVGATVLGNGLKVSIQGTQATEARITVTFAVPNVETTYKVKFFNYDYDDPALIVAVWKV